MFSTDRMVIDRIDAALGVADAILAGPLSGKGEPLRSLLEANQCPEDVDAGSTEVTQEMSAGSLVWKFTDELLPNSNSLIRSEMEKQAI
jgi:hypothetical protein